MIRRCAFLLAVVGGCLLIVSSFFAPYKNQAAVEQAMLAYPSDLGTSRAASEKYWTVRDVELTPKFSLQNYGFTLICAAVLIGLGSFVLAVRRLNDLTAITTPSAFWKLTVLGVSAAIVTPIAYVASLFLDVSRDEFPPSADSLGIPLAGAPVMLVFLSVVVIVWSLFGRVGFRRSERVADAFRVGSRFTTIWWALFGGPMVLSVVMTVWTALTGDFLFLVPCVLWTLFFLFLLAGKQVLPTNTALNTDVRQESPRAG